MLIGIKTWTRGNPGNGKGYSCRVSLRSYIDLNLCCVGFHLVKEWRGEWKLYCCPLPFCVIRLHYIRSYGGRFHPRSGLRGLREVVDSGT